MYNNIIIISHFTFHNILFSQLPFQGKISFNLCQSSLICPHGWWREISLVTFGWKMFGIKHIQLSYSVQGKDMHTQCTQYRIKQSVTTVKKWSPKRHFTNEISWRHDKRNLIIHHFATLCSVFSLQWCQQHFVQFWKEKLMFHSCFTLCTLMSVFC